MNAADLQDQLDKSHAEMKRINMEGYDLRCAIAELVDQYATKYGCDASTELEVIDTALNSLVLDAEGPTWRRICRISNEIGRLEDAA